MKKRILPALLALCMVMSMLPAAAFATDPTCDCTVDHTSSGGSDHTGGCTTAPVNGDTKCAACGGVEKFECTCTGDCVEDGDGTTHAAGHSTGYTLNTASVCTACSTAKAALCAGTATTAGTCTATTHKPGCIEACTADENCEATGTHKTDCPMDATNCTEADDCTNGVHTANCPAGCTMGNDCTNATGGHKDGCVKIPCAHDAGCTSGNHTVVYIVKKDGVAQGEPYATLASAKTAADAIETGVVTIVAAYCPEAGLPDVEVVSAEDEETEEPTTEEPTTEEPTTIEKAEDFSDVEADDWYAEDLTTALEKGWIVGDTDGSFGGDNETTGEMVVVLLSRVLGKDLVTTGANWTEEAIAWAAEEGLTEGVEITNGEIARKDLVLIMWRAAGSPESEQDLADFTDVDELEGDYLTAMKWAVEVEIIKGNGDGTITPDGATLRSQMVALLSRFDAAVNK